MKSESDIDRSKTSVPTNGSTAGTPHYVLMEGDRRLGPEVVRSDSGPECLVVYGFSDKTAYDRFCHDTKPELAPYPLVKGYLREQVDATGDGLSLVAVDAVGLWNSDLRAATMKAVLQAQENRAAYVAAAYRLIFDPAVKAYRVEKADV